MWDFFKAFEDMYKNNKALIPLIFFGLLIFLGYASASILSASDTLASHESRIESNEKSIEYIEESMANIVHRASFNAYIKRKDEELLKQMDFNQEIAQQIGFLSGQMYITTKQESAQ